MDKKLFGRRVNAARKDCGLTGERLAEACNINATYLRQIKSGTKVPSLPVFITLCKEMNVPPGYLLADELPCTDNDPEALIELLKNGTPSQIRLVGVMIRAALGYINDEQ